MFISFAWTSKSFIDDMKCVTRRYWKDNHAKKFNVNMKVDAYDKLPYRGGKKIGEFIIIKKPFQQRTGEMTEEDYMDEGLQYMEQRGWKINGQKPRDFFLEWKKKNDLVWVIKYKKLN